MVVVQSTHGSNKCQYNGVGYGFRFLNCGITKKRRARKLFFELPLAANLSLIQESPVLFVKEISGERAGLWSSLTNTSTELILRSMSHPKTFIEACIIKMCDAKVRRNGSFFTRIFKQWEL